MDARTLEVQTDDYLSLFAALWTASHLQVTAGGLKFEFELISSGEVLSTLLQCVLRQTGFARRASTAWLGTRSGPNARDEAKAIAVEMLAYARVADFQFLTSTAEQTATAWKTGLVTSGVDILEPSGAKTVDDLPTKLLEVELRKCRSGFFFAWAMEEIDQSKMARSFATCQTPDGTTFVYYSAAPRPKSGFYLLSSRTSGSGFGGVVQQQLEQMDARLRSSLMLAVNKVGQEDVGHKPVDVGTPAGEAGAREKIDMRPPGRD
jgi:hypothetical protein